MGSMFSFNLVGEVMLEETDSNLERHNYCITNKNIYRISNVSVFFVLKSIAQFLGWLDFFVNLYLEWSSSGIKFGSIGWFYGLLDFFF